MKIILVLVTINFSTDYCHNTKLLSWPNDRQGTLSLVSGICRAFAYEAIQTT